MVADSTSPNTLLIVLKFATPPDVDMTWMQAAEGHSLKNVSPCCPF
jgi:hypothetical protein